jgi:diacylglycerol kinase (ATP)
MVEGMNETGLKRLYLATLNSARGLSHAARTEAAFRQELYLLFAGVVAAVWLAPGPGWFVAMVAVLLILPAVELLNTAIEKLSDHVMPKYHEQIKVVKDLGSAAVFFALLLVALVWGAALIERFGLSA